jgi:hypothetical protein
MQVARAQELRAMALPLALVNGLTVPVGLILGGILADWASRHSRPGKLAVCLAASVAILPVAVMTDPQQFGTVLLFLAAYHALSGITMSCGLTAILDLAPSRFRGVALGGILALPAYTLGVSAIILASGGDAGPGRSLAMTITAGIALALVGLLPNLWRSPVRAGPS